MLGKRTRDDVLIVAPTPQFLERDVLWFSKNENAIKQALRNHVGNWERSARVFKKGETIRPSFLSRALYELGYEKTSLIFGKGEYVQKGNIVEIAPINHDTKITIEFYGNTIEEILEVPFEKKSSKRFLKEKDFRPGDYLVHLDHGIGIFRGTTQKLLRSDTSAEQEYYIVEYAAPRESAKPDTLYVPFSQKKKLDRYIGFETPTIHRLGGTVWFNTRKKAREDIEKFACHLLEIYRRRLQATSPPMPKEKETEDLFAESFPYSETPDQAKAIDDILSDMEKMRPMDRILAGDVGFGKTEVAFRAALRAITNGYQALLLAPTTILAEEHLRSAHERFRALPIRIAVLSRLTPEAEAKEILRDFTKGAIDLLIGTHRLLSKDILSAFLNPVPTQDVQKKGLGLLIIDEEQRFGVKQKETIKNIRSHIHIVSISATPIPRTLSLALAGIRDISIIQTQPEKRIPIKTFIAPYREKLVREAIEKELKRYGQVFFLHNRIETLDFFRKKILALVPSARIECIHGKTETKALLGILKNFRNKKIDVLVATTIIENGIDFPNANTLIVEDAARLGLSEAHQLRGRIGRGDRESYAYFLYRSRSLTENARLRLDALSELTDLGDGYEIALKDLEIRGAGNVLGREQSGTAHKVGLNLYYHMLSDAIESMKE